MGIRVYGKILEEWRSQDLRGREIVTQREIEYKEYDSETGELVGVGSEDFSLNRWHKEVVGKYIWIWDGQKRNKGGRRWFEDRGYIKFRKSERAAVRRFLNNKYEAAELQLR